MGLDGFLVTFDDGLGRRSITDGDHAAGRFRSRCLGCPRLHCKAAVRSARPEAGQTLLRGAREDEGNLLGLMG